MTQTYLAFYKGKKPLNDKATLQDSIICMIDGSDYSHVELVLNLNEQGIGDCMSSSNRDGGVRRKDIQLGNGRWLLIPVIVDISHVNKVYNAYSNAGYDYLGLGSSQLNWFPSVPNRITCSAFAATIFGSVNPRTIGIKELYEYVRYKQKGSNS